MQQVRELLMTYFSLGPGGIIAWKQGDVGPRIAQVDSHCYSHSFFPLRHTHTHTHTHLHTHTRAFARLYAEHSCQDLTSKRKSGMEP